MLASLSAAALAAALVHSADGDRPPRPADQELLAAVLADAPASRILSSAFREAPRASGRIGCGLAEVKGRVEPFVVFTLWKEAEPARISSLTITMPDEHGRPQVHTVNPPAPEEAGWRTHVSVPPHDDRNRDGETDRYDRNFDVLRRRVALSLCEDLAPPTGVTWATEIEQDPDPARAEQNRRRAQAITDLIFGVEGARSGAAGER